MERNPKMRQEYHPSQWGKQVPFTGRESIEKAFQYGEDISSGSGLVRLSLLSEKKKPLLKRLWLRITRRES